MFRVFNFIIVAGNLFRYGFSQRGVKCSILLLLALFACRDGPDPCEDVLCLNEARCNGGTCECVDGFSGSVCEDQLIPAKVLISKIRILNFPLKADKDWDADGNADIYLIVRNGARKILFQSSVIENAPRHGEYEFIPGSPIEIHINGRDDYSAIFELQDYDDEMTSQFIHGIICPIYDEDNKFPSEFDCWYERGERFHFIYELGYVFS